MEPCNCEQALLLAAALRRLVAAMSRGISADPETNSAQYREERAALEQARTALGEHGKGEVG